MSTQTRSKTRVGAALAALALAAVIVSRLRGATTYYAAPGSGSGCNSSVGWASGTGAIGCPWTLGVALNGGPGGTTVQPGDTIIVKAGTYSGVFASNLKGTAGSPIIVRNEQDGTGLGGRVRIDGGNSNGNGILRIAGRYTWYWGLEIFSSDLDRQATTTDSWPTGTELPRGECLYTVQDPAQTGPGLKFINMVAHDCRQGFSIWRDATDSELNGVISYYNGWNAPDRTHGHGIYTQIYSGTRLIKDSVTWNNFSHGFHAYGGDQNNVTFDGIVGFGIQGWNVRNFLFGGPPINNGLLTNSSFYRPHDAQSPQSDIQVGYGGNCTNVSITNNNIMGNMLFYAGCQSPSVTMTGNGIQYGGLTGLTTGQYPSNNWYLNPTVPGTNWVNLQKSDYESGRGLLSIHNWQMLDTVNVDISSIIPNGSNYEIRDIQNLYGTPVVSATYGGGTVAVPMTNTTTEAGIGWTPPPHTSKQWGSFLILVTSGGAPTQTPTNTQTFTQSPTNTQTFTPSLTFTASQTPTNTATPAGPTNTPSPTLTPVPGGCTYIEAESGTLVSPMVSHSDVNASGGLYVTSDTANTGTDTFTFSLPNGTYYLSHRVIAQGLGLGADDSLFSLIDNESGGSDATHIDDVAEGTSSSNWQTTRLVDRAIAGCNPPLGNNPAACQRTLVISDSPANHTLRLRMREVYQGRGTYVDWVALCPDANLPPGPQATPTPTNTSTPTLTNTPVPPTDTPGGPTATNTNTPSLTNTPTPTFTRTPTFTPSVTRTPDSNVGPTHTHFCNGRKYRHAHPPTVLLPHTHPCPFPR